MDELLKNKTFAIHAVSAAGAVSLGTALTYPLDTLKVLIQVGSSPERPLSAEAVLNRVRAMAGNSGLYNGIGWFTLGRTLGLGARFVTYEILTAFCKDVEISGCIHGDMDSVKVKNVVCQHEHNHLDCATLFLSNYNTDLASFPNSANFHDILSCRKFSLLKDIMEIFP